MSRLQRHEQRELLIKAILDSFVSPEAGEANVVENTNNFVSASDDESEDETLHPTTNPAFLEALIADALTPKERADFIRHLVDCPRCRDHISVLIEVGALGDRFKALSNIKTETSSTTVGPRVKRESRSASSALKRRYSVVAVAASLLIVAVGLTLWSANARIASNNLELARLELKLAQDSDGVADFVSPRLTDFNYWLSGNDNGVKTLSPFDDKTSVASPETIAAFEKLLELAPNDETVRLDFARHLLQNRTRLDRAEEILNATSQTPEVVLLSSVCAFLQGDVETAQDGFQQVLEEDSKNEIALLNLAICKARLKRFNEAEDLYRQLYDATSSAKLKEQIEVYLKERQ